MNRRLFLARLAPIDKTVHIREPGFGVASVKLCRTALDAQRPKVGEDVPVLLAHDADKRVGRVVALTVSNGWYVATLDVDPGANELVRCGQPVSVGLELGQTSHANEWTDIERVASARLTEVSICRQGAVPGAEVVAVLSARPKKSIVVNGVELLPGEELLDERGRVMARCGVGADGGAVRVR